MNVGDRQRGEHTQLLERVRAKSRGCATLATITALHEPGLVVTDGHVLCSACRETWPCATVQTIQEGTRA